MPLTPPRRASCLAALLLLGVMGCKHPALQRTGASPSAPDMPSEWPTFQRDNARTGAQPDAPALRRKPTILWSKPVGAQAASHSPLLVGELVIVASHGARGGADDASDGVVALRRDTGERAWFWATREDVHTTAYASGVLIAAGARTTWALDARTGALLWRAGHPRGHGAVHATLIVGDHVVLAHAKGHLVARSLTRGAPLWHARLSGPVARGLASASSVVLVGTLDGAVSAHDLDSGRPLWKTTLPDALRGAILAPPTIHNRHALISASTPSPGARSSMLALHMRDGALAWSTRHEANTSALPGSSASATIAHARYHLPLDGSTYLVGVAHANTAQLDYTATTGPCLPTSPASPVATAGVVYLPRADGALYAFSMDNSIAPGFGLWRLYLGDAAQTDRKLPAHLKALPKDRCPPTMPPLHPLLSTPAIGANGDVFVTSAAGVLYRLGG